ncbi:hypothetical protein [Bradyrhizobium sp. sBnM-33]|uniref:hypothetical protein n=1 Tax=Bradyrhizobium sp. sBnM-33 TaxID=2831780 RepID=UPI001BCDC391|nr:hypothetical protein [Bradyrhizobium sp. sBnM-33]WOH47646.1 hypothetical protein RX328_26130 [Bradyrhizobium sp. sBnM-33]
MTIKSTEFPESDSVESDECEAARRQRKIVADELIVAYELRHPKTPNEHAPTLRSATVGSDRDGARWD